MSSTPGGITGQALGISIGTNAAIATIVFVAFSILRVHKHIRLFYSPRSYSKYVESKPARLQVGIGWVRTLWAYPEDEVVKTAGLDACVFLRLIRFGLKLFFWVSLWCCAVILPVNYTGNGTDASDGLAMVSSAHVGTEIDRYWAHAITAYVVSIIAMKMLWDFSSDVSVLRLRFLSTQPPGGPTHSVLVTDIPGIAKGTLLKQASKYRDSAVATLLPEKVRAAMSGGLSVADEQDCSTPLNPWTDAQVRLEQDHDVKDLVLQEFEHVYGAGTVAAVNVVRVTDALEAQVAKYDKLKGQYEDLVDECTARLRRRQPTKPKQVRILPLQCGAWAVERYGNLPVKISAWEFYPLALRETKAAINQLQQEAQGSCVPTAFVTFKERYQQAVAASGLHSHDETAWRVQDCPGADEVVWHNLRYRSWNRSLRNVAVWLGFVAIILFYLPITAVIQGFINFPQLVEVLPWISFIEDSPFLMGLVQSILPGLALKLFLIILPPVLYVMNRKAGLVSISQIDFAVVSQYFIFQFFATFLFTLILGSVASQLGSVVGQLQQYLENPKQLLEVIGNGLVTQANFYMSYLATSALLARPIGMMRFVGLILFWVFTSLAATDRARARIWDKQVVMFGTAVADHTMAILLGLVFCCVNPVMPLIVLMYFVVITMVERYSLIYVTTRPYESAGKLWPRVVKQVMVGLYTFQVALFAFLSIRGFYASPVILPMILFTAVYHSALSTLFDRPWRLLSLRAATDFDLADKANAGDVEVAGDASAEVVASVHELYLAPVFKVSEEDLEALCAEADQLQKRVQSGLLAKDGAPQATDAPHDDDAEADQDRA